MPLPKPKPDESKDTFLARCMGDETMLGEYPDEKQRYAVCNSSFEAATKSEQAKQIICSMPAPEGAPQWWLLWPRGWNELEGQNGDEPVKFLVDDEAIAAILADFARRGNEKVIDYEHQTLTGQEAPAAGWIKGFDGREDGLWIWSDWTPKASGYLGNKEYRYVSPVFDLRLADSRPVAIRSVALTNDPRTNHAIPLVAKLNLTKQKEDASMKELLAKLGKILSVEGDPTEEAIIAAITSKMGTPEAKVPAEVIAVLDLKAEAGTSEIVATIRALKQGAGEHTKLAAKVKTLEAESAERTKTELVAKAIKEGKITPAQKEWADKYAIEDPKGFEVFISKAPVIVPVDQRITGGEPPKPETGLDETQLVINKMLGVSKETWEKFGPVMQKS